MTQQLFFKERSLSCEMTQLVSHSFGCERQAVFLMCHVFVPQAGTVVHHFFVDVPSCFPVVKPSLMSYGPRAEGVRRKARFRALVTGLAFETGAVSALLREKKKADHALHDHTFHEYLPFSVCGSTNLCRSPRVACQTCLMP